MIGKNCIVRTYSAGVLAGTIVSRDGKEVVMANARRIWYWEGAASLSELAVKGTSKPTKCKFPIAVPEILLTDVIEIIPMTAEAQKSIDVVPVWTLVKLWLWLWLRLRRRRLRLWLCRWLWLQRR